MRRSPELKKTLSEAIGAEDIHHAAEEAISISKFYASGKDKRLENIRRQYEEERENINAITERMERLRAEAETLSDAEFETRFSQLASSIEESGKRIERDENERNNDRGHVAEFFERGEIKTFENFIEKFPMFWVPRKADISRIVAFAKRMHETALARGEKRNGEPIRIIDVGGSNGFLGTLVTEMARENGLNIEYMIVDPDQKTVKLAAKAYEKNKNLKFRAAFAGDVAEEAVNGDSELMEQLNLRKWLKSEGTPKLKDLDLLKQVIYRKQKDEQLDDAAIEKFRKIIAQDFGITIKTPAGDAEAFLQAVNGDWKVSGAYKTYFGRAQEQITETALNIDRELLKRTSTHDLVINSWMPPGTDFTQDIRAINGRAILYITETWGATGVQQGSKYPREITRLGEENSYGPGALYEPQLAWVGNSTPELANRQRAKKGGYRTHGTHDYSNAFLFQTKKNYGLSALDCAPEKMSIKTKGEYPWEKELNARGKLSPVRQLKKNEDYHETLETIIEDLGGEW